MFDFLDPEQEHTDAVPSDRFDRAMWDEVREESSTLDDTVKGLQRDFDYAEDFAQDAFNLLAKGDPTFRDPQHMKATHIPNRQVIEDVAKLPELERLRQYTVGDNYASAAGFLALEEGLKGALSKAAELKEQAAAAQQAVEDARQAQQDAADGSGDQEAAEQAAQNAQQALEGLQQQAQQASASARSQMRKALNDATKEAEEEQETASSYGVGAGDLRRMNFRDRAALAKRLSGSKLKKFAALIGAFKQLASAEYRRRSVDGSDEVVGVELGDDLTRLTTQEMISLASDETRKDFWRRYVERGLLIKKLRGRERDGKGPIIVVADESGSMAGAGEMWAKGLALALLDQAGKQKRDFHYIGFAGTDQLREFAFPGGKIIREEVLDMAEGFINGGTSFEKPLRRALSLVQQASLHKPDIVFITDGDAAPISFQEEWDETRKRLGVRCYGIFVTSGHGGRPAQLQQIADNVRTVSDLTDVTQATDIMRQA